MSKTLLLLGLAALSAATGTGCGEGGGDAPAASRGDTGTPDGFAGPDVTGYALCVSTATPDGSTGLIVGVDDVAEGVLTLGSGVEIGSGGPPCAPAFGSAFVGVGDSPVVTRYERNDEGLMVPGPRVSFVGEGVERIFSGRGRYFRFLSEERALYIDRTTGIVVVFDPTEMVVLGSVQLEGFEVEGATASLVPPIASEGRDDLLLYVRYVSSIGVQLPQAALISLDVDTLEHTVTRDARCGGLANDVQTSEGTIYVASSTFVTAQRMLGLADEAPCMLRVLPGETRFDPDFYVALSDLTGGLPTGAMLRGPGDGALLKAYDAAVLDPSDFLTTFQVGGAASWRVFRIEDLDDVATADAVAGFPVQTGQGNEIFETRGRRYLLRLEPDFLSSVLQDVTDPAAIRDALTIRGGFFIGGGELDRCWPSSTGSCPASGSTSAASRCGAKPAAPSRRTWWSGRDPVPTSWRRSRPKASRTSAAASTRTSFRRSASSERASRRCNSRSGMRWTKTPRASSRPSSPSRTRRGAAAARCSCTAKPA